MRYMDIRSGLGVVMTGVCQQVALCVGLRGERVCALQLCGLLNSRSERSEVTVIYT